MIDGQVLVLAAWTRSEAHHARVVHQHVQRSLGHLQSGTLLCSKLTHRCSVGKVQLCADAASGHCSACKFGSCRLACSHVATGHYDMRSTCHQSSRDCLAQARVGASHDAIWSIFVTTVMRRHAFGHGAGWLTQRCTELLRTGIQVTTSAPHTRVPDPSHSSLKTCTEYL